jgi:hypothetical protein
MKQNIVPIRPKQVSPAVLPLFVSPQLRDLETRREQLAARLERMRKERRHGAIIKTEARLQDVTTKILAIWKGKEIAS